MTDWQELLQEEQAKDYYHELQNFIAHERLTKTIFPPEEEVFNAFHYTPYQDVKVVILGQDPYHGERQSHGLSFSVKKGVKIPPSLRNIYQELEADLGIKAPNHGELTSWAQQGVLLLNTVLTVEKAKANSHRGKGWEKFTDQVIRLLNEREEPIIFVLWGNPAKTKKAFIDTTKHKIIESTHPSPLSAYRGFLGSKPFSQINQQLIKWDKEPINWEIK
ncbi:Uracil-DNA glycosylase [Granulicatella balaenopterae]|uniref:Uracil-DNA glycosylase n=1 Tax=Granulicatella balaenopterae TaxID=137733 RepID=A0A1H9K2C4_9LACT|nr:uracil-DNA glycosylase [Granulicatella balaenopterae]SEQ93401.1 Uracil-DNA glycosylase [Granulicatella balaenopterae]